MSMCYRVVSFVCYNEFVLLGGLLTKHE